MLCIEYDQRKEPIAGLTIADANACLKELIRKYIKGVYPFDRDFRADETAHQWWVSINNDKSMDAQPLAVSVYVISVFLY